MTGQKGIWYEHDGSDNRHDLKNTTRLDGVMIKNDDKGSIRSRVQEEKKAGRLEISLIGMGVQTDRYGGCIYVMFVDFVLSPFLLHRG